MVESTIGQVAVRESSREGAGVTRRAVRRGSWVAGLALLVMTPLAAYANFVVLDGLVAPGDAALTARAIANAEGAFRVAVASLYVVAVLDLLVAWALYTVFEPVNRRVAALMAWFRVAFAAVFVVAISQLVGVLSAVNAAGASAAFSPAQRDAQALLGVETFYGVWDGALILVGLHLVVLGYLVYRVGAVRSHGFGYVTRALGVLLVVAGAGYVVDSVGRVLIAGYSFEVAAVTFLGEVVLIVWLFMYGRRLGVDDAGASASD